MSQKESYGAHLCVVFADCIQEEGHRLERVGTGERLWGMDEKQISGQDSKKITSSLTSLALHENHCKIAIFKAKRDRQTDRQRKKENVALMYRE